MMIQAMGKYKVLLLLVAICHCHQEREEIELLKCKIDGLEKSNSLLEKSYERLEKSYDAVREEIKELKKQVLPEASALSAYCKSLRYDICGECTCLDDYALEKRYYCDCQHLPATRDCLEHLEDGYNTSGVYKVNAGGIKDMQVYCDQDTDNGGWTVFQRRVNGQTNFYRGWSSYKDGFGNPQREFWLGNDKLYLLTYQAEYPEGSELRIDMEDWSDNKYFAQYTTFLIDNEDEKYKLHVKGFTGNAGDSLSGHNGFMFSTYDADNDVADSSCASTYHGAWWYSKCHSSNLNGEYRWFGETVPYARGVIWKSYKDYYYSMKFVEMKVRRKD